MSRCPFYDQSKYGLHPKKKQCRNVATAKVTFPTSDFDKSFQNGLTEIHIGWICAFHASLIADAKKQQIAVWQEREASVLATMNGNGNHS